MLILFRVDASPTIGLGHVKRCLSLAHALRGNGAEVQFVARDLGVDVAKVTSGEGFQCSILRAPNPGEFYPGRDPSSHEHWAGVGWEVDLRETVAAASGRAIDWIVIDHYSFGAPWHRGAAQALGARIAVIDDLGDRDLGADVLIDHNYATDHRLKYRARLRDGVPILGGPRYALLSPAYATAAKYQFHAAVRSIGIFMGGVDAGNYSSLVLEACRKEANYRGPIEVVTTRSNPNLLRLTQLAETFGDTRILQDLPDLTKFFARHDLQIGAAGGAVLERACIGAPTLALICAENQLLAVPIFRDLGVAETIDDSLNWSSVTARDIGSAIRRLLDDVSARRVLAERSRALVDGRGALRAAEFLLAQSLEEAKA